MFIVYSCPFKHTKNWNTIKGQIKSMIDTFVYSTHVHNALSFLMWVLINIQLGDPNTAWPITAVRKQNTNRTWATWWSPTVLNYGVLRASDIYSG